MLEGVNDHELDALVDYFAQDSASFVLRFIEYMPFEQRLHRSVSSHLLRRRLRERFTLEPLSERLGDGPAVSWRLVENGLRVGFISPLSERFCSTCNRLRLSAEGNLRTCLSDDGTPSLAAWLRDGSSDDAIEAAIRTMVMGKREGHGATIAGGTPFEGVMTRVGG
jgi:cyclic pyranopterin phosphate synthase